MNNPLKPWTYLVRNAGKSVPLMTVIVLAVVLVYGIVVVMNSIPLSIRTIYGYSRYSLGVNARGDPDLVRELQQRIRSESPVPIDRMIICRGSSAQVKSIVGKWPFVVLAMTQDDMRYYLRKLGNAPILGRLPAPGRPEALVSAPVARNLGLQIGSALLKPTDPDAFSPREVRVVGIARTENWIMLAPIEYYVQNHFPPVDSLLVMAATLEDQDRLDRWAMAKFNGERAQLFAYYDLERSTNEMFSVLYRILDVVIGTLVVVITIMMAMLINIYQSQRMQEFALLQAIGAPRRALTRRVIAENLMIVVVGWSIGIGLSYVLLRLFQAAVMSPRAYAIDCYDTTALLYTVPIPVAILLAAALGVAARFRKFDPVAIVERRLV